MTRLLAWFDDMPEFGMTSHKDCGFATIIVVNEKGEWEPIEKYFDAEGLIRWSNKVYDMVQDKEVPKPTSFLKGDDESLLFRWCNTIHQKSRKNPYQQDTPRFCKTGGFPKPRIGSEFFTQ